jgi:hypothetical protein
MSDVSAEISARCHTSTAHKHGRRTEMYSWKIDPEMASSLPTAKKMETRQLGMPYECGFASRPTPFTPGGEVIRSEPLGVIYEPLRKKASGELDAASVAADLDAAIQRACDARERLAGGEAA